MSAAPARVAFPVFPMSNGWASACTGPHLWPSSKNDWQRYKVHATVCEFMLYPDGQAPEPLPDEPPLDPWEEETLF